MARILITITLLSCSFVPVVSAQTTTSARALDVYELVLKDGSRMFGTIERETNEEVVFKSTGGAVLTAKRTEIVTLANGFEERNTPWAHSRRRYDAGVGLRSLDDVEALIAFFEARRGQMFGFRWKD